MHRVNVCLAIVRSASIALEDCGSTPGADKLDTDYQPFGSVKCEVTSK